MPRKARAAQENGKDTRFKPGESGNPNGRTPMPAEFRDACRMAAWEHLDVMRGILTNTKVRVELKIKAWEALANRGFGMPKGEIEVTDRRTTPVIFAPPRCHSFDEWLERFGPNASKDETIN